MCNNRPIPGSDPVIVASEERIKQFRELLPETKLVDNTLFPCAFPDGIRVYSREHIEKIVRDNTQIKQTLTSIKEGMLEDPDRYQPYLGQILSLLNRLNTPS